MQKIIIFILFIILFSTFCKKQYLLKAKWKFNTNKDTARIELKYLDNLYISAGEYLNTNSPNHLIYCINIKTGRLKWKYDIGAGIILYKIELFKKKLFLVDIQDNVSVLNALNGLKVQSTSPSAFLDIGLNHSYMGNPVAAVPGNEALRKPSRIVCRNTDGKVLWSYPVKPLPRVKEPYVVNFSFLLDGRNLILATYDGKVKSIVIK